MNRFPRYAVLGNGYDEWEVVILFGNALRRGYRAVESIVTYTAQQEMATYKLYREKNGEEITDTSIVRGYGIAHRRAMKKYQNMVDEVPM